MNIKRLKKISIAVIGLACAGVAIFLLTSREAIASAMIDMSDFKKIVPDIYFEPGAPQGEEEKFLALYKAAKERISTTFGEYTAQPILIVGYSEKMRRYGNGYGTSHFFPGKSFVVIGPKGFNVDVISHELAHAELFHRIGFWKRMTQIPVWFDEGMAMQLDHREAYNIEKFQGKTLPSKEKLWWAMQFTSGGNDVLMLSYVASKDIVKNWCAGQKPSRFYELLNQIKQGVSFDEAFADSGAKS
jgi:hypothetical protein